MTLEDDEKYEINIHLRVSFCIFCVAADASFNKIRRSSRVTGDFIIFLSHSANRHMYRTNYQIISGRNFNINIKKSKKKQRQKEGKISKKEE